MLLRRLAYIKTSIYKLIFRIVVALIYKNKAQRKRKLKEWTTKVEKKYLKRYLYVLSDSAIAEPVEKKKIIWICWLQGENNAPDIVKACIKSVRKQMSESEIVLLTNDNLKQYISFPDYIFEKKEKGYIANAQFSDLIRLNLLSRYGGIWIDATVYLTKPLSKQITDTSFFAYHSNIHLKNNNWLLQASSNNFLINNMQNLLLEYWKYENRMLNYFVYHLFFDLMIEENSVCREEWQKVPLLYDTDCYELAENLLEPFNEDKLKKIKQDNSVHKLTYKYKKDRPIQNTFLEYLVNNIHRPIYSEEFTHDKG